jgi:Fic family protein
MKPFIPEKLPPHKIDYKQLISLVGEANAALARYDGLLQAVVNPEIMLSPLTTREAVLSSKIEGTQATMDEVLENEAGVSVASESKQQDIQEIVNYRSTLIQAETALASGTLGLFLVRQMHSELMRSVRGENKQPGQFRDRQNWIGKPGAPLEEAVYVPPEPHLLQTYLEDLESYIQSHDGDVLVQSAIIHAQFEIIHPFLNGNGRIGRLITPLFLYYKKRLRRPMFYISEYLEAHRETYYAKLRAVSTTADWNAWIAFYLEAVKTQGDKNAARIQQIIKLHQETRVKIRELTRTQYSAEIADAIFRRPIFRATDLQLQAPVPKQTLMPILKKLIEAGILVTVRAASGRRPAVMKFPDLLDIIEG